MQAPVRQDQPTPTEIDRVLAAADALRPLWPIMHEQLAGGLTCEVPGGEPGGGPPAPAPPAPAPTPAPGDQPPGGVPPFTEVNPNDLPPEAKAAYDAAYQRMQADYTAKTQEIAGVRQEAEQAGQILAALSDPTTQPAMLAMLGIELEEEAPPPAPGDFDPMDYLYSEVQGIKGQLGAEAEQEQAAQYMEAEKHFLAEQIEELEQSTGREFDGEEINLLSTVARANRLDNGAPNVQAAYGLLDGVLTQSQQRFVNSRTARRRPSTGAPGGTAPDLKTEAGRLEAMAAAAEEAMARE